MSSQCVPTDAKMERIKLLIKAFVAANQGYLKPLYDRALEHLPEFLVTLGENRPLAIYDYYGQRLVRSEAHDYSEALVLLRGGLDGDQFQICVPHVDFDAPDNIGIAREQKAIWGAGFKTAYVHTNGNSLFVCLSILHHVKSNNDLSRIVTALDPETGPAKLISDVVQPQRDHEDFRSAFGEWLVQTHPDILLDTLDCLKSPPAAQPLPVPTKPDADITDEERLLARQYLARDTKGRWLEALGEGGSLRENFGAEAVGKIFEKLPLDKETRQISNVGADGPPPGKDAIFRRFHDLVLSSPANVQIINEFYADMDLSRPSVSLDPSDDPNAFFVGTRDLPVANFVGANTRAMEAPQVDHRQIGRRVALGRIPENQQIDIAGVGNGPADVFAGLELAKIAADSKCKIRFSIFELVSNPKVLGRFLTHIFPGGAKAELGAMRFPPTSITFYFLVLAVLGPDAVARTFPNHHIMNSRFMLRELFGARGENQDPTGPFVKDILPVYEFVLKRFAAIETTIDGETFTYQDIEDFLISNKMQGRRTPNRAYKILQAFLDIDQKHRQTYAAFVEEAVRKGLKSKDIPLNEKAWSRLFASETGVSQAEIIERDLIVQKEAQKFLDVGKGTGGWGSYADMSIPQELITRSINSTEEFDFPVLIHGVQEFGRLIRDKAREIGGKYFELHLRLNAKVCGLGKGLYDAKKQALSKSGLLYQELDPQTGADVGKPQLREFDFILSTVSPAVLAKTVAPQMGGTGYKAMLEGIDAYGRPRTQIYDDPFRVHTQDAADLDTIHPLLKNNNLIVWFWAHFTRMFGTTKVAYETTIKLYDQVAPRDENFPSMAVPVVPNIEAIWIAVPVAKENLVEDSRDFTYHGLVPVVHEATFRHSNKEYKWIRVSKHYYEALPNGHPARTRRGPDERRWLPISMERLAEFGFDNAAVGEHYGDKDPISVIDGTQCIWLPVTDKVYDEMEDDDPIKQRFEQTCLAQQKALTYVVPMDWVDEKFTAEDKTKLLSVKTRAGHPGFYITVPADCADAFEENLDDDRWQLTDHETARSKAPANEIYRVRSDGPRVGGLQVPGGPRNFYLIVSPDAKTAAQMEYNWDRDGHKLGASVSSFTKPDTDHKPVKRLGAANSFLFGGMANPIRILTDGAQHSASMNYSRAENYLGAFAMLGPGDVAKSFAVYSFFKNVLLFKYDPKLFCPPSILPSGEAASLNPGWVNPGLYATYGPLAAIVIMAGGTLNSGAVELFFGAPPLFSLAEITGGLAYPTFGLKAEKDRQTRIAK